MATSAAYIDLTEGAAPSTPAAGKVRQYAKADGNLYQKDDTGAESALAGAGSSISIVRKTADEIVNNSAAVQNDDHLLLALDATAMYRFEFDLFFDAHASADLKIAITVPAGATLRWWTPGGLNNAGTGWGMSTITASGTTRDFEANGVGTIRALRIIGFVETAGTAGNLQLQWAQNTANASDATVRENSSLVAYKLG